MGQTLPGMAFDGSGGLGVGVAGVRERVLILPYDFAVQGGAAGTIAIGALQQGEIIIGGFFVVATALTSGGAARVGIDSEGTGDILATALVSGAPWSTTGKKAIVPKINTPESTSITTTAGRNINVNITVAALTAGKFTLYLIVI